MRRLFRDFWREPSREEIERQAEEELNQLLQASAEPAGSGQATPPADEDGER